MNNYIFLDTDQGIVVAMFLSAVEAECHADLSGYRYICMRATPKWYERAPRLGKVYYGTGKLRFNNAAAYGTGPRLR